MTQSTLVACTPPHPDPNPESRIPNPESRIPNPESLIPNPCSLIPARPQARRLRSDARRCGSRGRRIAQVVMPNRFQRVVQLVDERDAGWNVQLDDGLLVEVVEVFHERAQAVA